MFPEIDHDKEHLELLKLQIWNPLYQRDGNGPLSVSGWVVCPKKPYDESETDFQYPFIVESSVVEGLTYNLARQSMFFGDKQDKFTSTEFSFLYALEHFHGILEVEELMEICWPDLTTLSVLRNTITRFNTKISSLGIPFIVRKNGNKVIWSE